MIAPVGAASHSALHDRLESAIVMVALIQKRRMPGIRSAASWASLLEGIRFVWHRKTVLGAISLDLFAVLFGGATALLPAFTRATGITVKVVENTDKLFHLILPIQPTAAELSEEELQVADLRSRGHDWASVARELGGTPEGRRKQLARAIQRVNCELGFDLVPG